MSVAVLCVLRYARLVQAIEQRPNCTGLKKAPLCFKWMDMSAIAASVLPERQHDRGNTPFDVLSVFREGEDRRANSVSCGDRVLETSASSRV